ncbi:DUF5688 family protein [Butyrivibrio sp. WCD3002]|uniref:DUF5688 family protein n=1 Tax=Butyrivibrio sp. WCD3002 TaxID=1280676 RepID=UPI000415C616|nr:DUF5688 family protein [Butyrivibrio sp. WCD3002]
MNSMMFEEFVNEIAGRIREFLPERFSNADVDIKVVTKNNSLRLTGLTIKEVDSNIAPTIYLEKFYEEYRDGEDMGTILQKIANMRTENEAPDNLDVESLNEFAYCMDRIVPRLVSLEMNKELLKDRPHMVIEDLAVQYYVILDRSEDGTAGVAVTNSIMRSWGVTTEELHKTALKNLPVIEQSTFQSMFEVLSRMIGGDFEDIMPEDSGMYVLSNKSKLHGASALLDTEMMNNIYEKLGGEFYVIPSSVHEVIILPMNLGFDSKGLKMMINEVNSTQVSLEDRLADHAYVYSIEEGLRTAA